MPRKQMPRRGPGQTAGDGDQAGRPLRASFIYQYQHTPEKAFSQGPDPVTGWLFAAASFLYSAAWRLRRAGLLRQAARVGASVVQR